MSGMNIVEQTKRITIITFDERLDAFNAPAARKEIDTAMENGAVNFVVNLKDVPFMDSAGVAVLVNLLKQSRQVGGDVRLVAPANPTAMRILKLTKFDRVFAMFETVEEAAESF